MVAKKDNATGCQTNCNDKQGVGPAQRRVSFARQRNKRLLLTGGPNSTETQRSHLHELTAQFPAGIAGRMDIDVPATGQQVGGLGVSQRRRARERARIGRNRHRDPAVLACFGRAQANKTPPTMKITRM